MFRPTLRGELVLRRDPEGRPLELVDPVVNGRTELGPISRAIVDLADGRRTLDEILDRAAERNPDAPRADVENAFRALLLMNLVEGSGTKILEQARAARAEEGSIRTVLVLEESRVGCLGSGSCCQGYGFGPLTPDDLVRLAQLPIDETYPHLADGFVETRKAANGDPVHFLRTTLDGSCVFLLPDRRCGVHAAFGARAKPGFCQLYPLKSLATIQGIKVYDAGECASYVPSALSGTAIAEDLQRIQDHVPRDAPLHHPAILVAPGAVLDFGHFLRLQDAACDVIDANPDEPLRAFARVLALVRAFADAIAACPLRAGEPDATVSAVLASRPPLLRTSPTPEERSALERVIEELKLALRPAPDAPPRARETARLEDSLVAILEPVAAGASVLPLSLDARRALQSSLKNSMFGDRILVEQRLGAGVLRLTLGLAVTLVGASDRARERGSPVVEPADLAHPHHVAHRVMRQASALKVFTAHDHDAWGPIHALASSLSREAGEGRGGG